jgi:hypothetical protein
MDGWIGWAIGLGVLAVLAPFVAMFGRRHGKAIKGGMGLAAVLLGIGYVVDPPAQRMLESVDEEQGSESTGEPKDATGGG